MKTLHKEIESLINPDICSKEVADYWRKRLAGDYKLTRDEGEPRHFCCYFLPYNPQAKKAQLWLAPGRHIDSGERPIEALNREIEEELGVPQAMGEEARPFLLTITPINNSKQPNCKEHLDIWYGVPTDGSNFNLSIPRQLAARLPLPVVI